MTLKEIVVLRLKQLKVGAVEAATGANIERTFIRDIVEGKKQSVRADKMEPLARALFLDPAALARGELVASDDAPDFTEPKVVPLRGRSSPRAGIPNLNIHAGMGPGGALSVTKNEAGEIYSDQSDGVWQFPDAVQAGWRNRPHVYSMPVTGDSMEPTLRDGSFVFVDTTHTVPAPEDIYAIDYGDGLMIKRVKMVPRSNKILIMSDNARYGTDELLRDDVRVYGRVVAWFQWRG